MRIETLKQYRALKQEIKLLEQQEEENQKEIVIDSVKGSSPCFPYIEHRTTIEGVSRDAAARHRARRLRRQIRRAEEMREEIERFIENIQDSQTRMIFYLRYVKGLSWQRVATEIGESIESYPRRKHNAYLLKLDENDEVSSVK